MTLAEAIEEWKKEQGFDKEQKSREMRTVKVSHEDMVFLRALVHPQPSHDEYKRIIDGCTISLWESEFDDMFSIGSYESDSVSCVLTFTEGCDYCEVLRLQIREKRTNQEHCILWSEVEFIEKIGDEIIVTGCRGFTNDPNEDDPVQMKYDLVITEGC